MQSGEVLTMADCKNCIHIEVCKSADSCDGRVPGCRHFEPKTKHGRWEVDKTVAFTEECSACGFCVQWDSYGRIHQYNHCPNCGAKMDLPRITEQTTKALEAMDRKAHGGADNG